MIDCKVDEWLRNLFVSAGKQPSPGRIGTISHIGPIDHIRPVGPADSAAAFDRYCNLVLEDKMLQMLLRDVFDKELFFETVVRLGNERGYHFSVNDVREAFRAKRRTWIERWV